MTDHDSVDELVGSMLGGRYRVVKKLARGGMGTVYEGLQEDLGRRVALKVVHPSLARHRATLERFRLEAVSAASLAHPHIVQVTDFQVNGPGPPFLVMDLLVGSSFEDVCRTEGPLPPRRVAVIASQVLDALATAHRAGIVHRDLKPSNVFLTSLSGVPDVVKLLDFGVAKMRESEEFQRLTATGALVGTPLFMAPEQARGEDVDGRADLYSLGMCMYVALTGHVPFPIGDQAELLRAIQDSEPVPLRTLRPDCEPALADVVAQAMDKDPGRRFQTADAMLGALRPWVESSVRAQHGAPAEVRVPDAARRADAVPEKKKRKRGPSGLLLAAFAAGGLLAAVAAALAVVFVLDGSASDEAPPAATTPTTTGPGPVEPPEPPVLMPSGVELPSPAPMVAAEAADAGGLEVDNESSSQERRRRRRRGEAGMAAACTPEVYLSSAHTYGLYGEDHIRRSIARLSPRLGRCVAEVPQNKPVPPIAVRVEAGGDVESVRLMRPFRAHPSAGSCVTRALTGLGLGPTNNGLAGELTIELRASPCAVDPWRSP